MAYKSGFFDAMDTGGGSYDRVYRAEDFAHYFSLFIRNGVFANPSTNLQVIADGSGMSVSIMPGNGWINGYYVTVEGGSPETLSLSVANATLSRIDSVIAGLDFADRAINLYIRSSEVATKPSAVTLQRDEDVYEIELAQIYVAAGASEISQSVITDSRFNETRCGIVKGLIDEIDTAEIFAQYNAKFESQYSINQETFNAWFENLEIQLSGDVAGNLQNQINALSSGKVNKAGDTMAGELHLSGTPTSDDAVVPKKYVDTLCPYVFPEQPDYEGVFTSNAKGIFKYIPDDNFLDCDAVRLQINGTITLGKATSGYYNLSIKTIPVSGYGYDMVIANSTQSTYQGTEVIPVNSDIILCRTGVGTDQEYEDVFNPYGIFNGKLDIRSFYAYKYPDSYAPKVNLSYKVWKGYLRGFKNNS